MKYIKSSLLISGCLIITVLIFFSPPVSSSAQLFYTIQIGSFINENAALQEFDFIVKVLNEKELDHLRIEKIGKYFTVRLGKYDNRSKAETFLGKIKSRIASAVVLDAYIKHDRITKLYGISLSGEVNRVKTKPLSALQIKETVKQAGKKKDGKPLSDELFYTIQTGSFKNAADAGKQFDSITKLLNRNDLDYMRVEKIGQYYSVRLGKFKGRNDAEDHLSIVRSGIPSAVVLKAYIKDERIIKSFKEYLTGKYGAPSEPTVGGKEVDLKETRIKEDVKVRQKVKQARKASPGKDALPVVPEGKKAAKVQDKKRRTSLPKTVSEKKEKPETAKAQGKPKPEKLFYMVQAKKNLKLEDARKQFDSIAGDLGREDLDHLRIEQTGMLYSVRLGKYSDYASAKKMHERIKNNYSDSVIIYDKYAEDESLVRLYDNKLSTRAHEVKSEPSRKKKDQRMIIEKQEENKAASETAEEPVREPPSGKVILQVAAGPVDSVSDDHKADRMGGEKAAPVKKEKPAIEKTVDKISPDKGMTGEIYAGSGRNFLAIEEYRKHEERNPAESREFAEVLYDTGFIDEAAVEMKKAVRAFPDNDDLRVRLGALYFANNMLEKAKEQFFTALEIDPGNTRGYIYLGETFIKTGEYDKAWIFAKMSQSVGHRGNDIIKRLRSLSTEPDVRFWNVNQTDLYVRQILVDDYGKAKSIVERISEGELFEDIARTESKGKERIVGGYMGHISSSEVFPEVADALVDRRFFADPIIVETKRGHHIVQLIFPFSVDAWLDFTAELR